MAVSNTSGRDPLVVLGARIIDGRPSRMLEARLRTAAQYVAANGRRPVVVSGYGEAAVMAAWLAEHGVQARDIIEEPLASSTNENLERSWALFPDAQRLIVVTNGFHVARVRVWAAHLEVPVTVVAAPTPRKSRLKNYARELIATPHSAARVVWRKYVRWRYGR
nr:membrane protein [Streptococcus thermophilus]